MALNVTTVRDGRKVDDDAETALRTHLDVLRPQFYAETEAAARALKAERLRQTRAVDRERFNAAQRAYREADLSRANAIQQRWREKRKARRGLPGSTEGGFLV